MIKLKKVFSYTAPFIAIAFISDVCEVCPPPYKTFSKIIVRLLHTRTSHSILHHLTIYNSLYLK